MAGIHMGGMLSGVDVQGIIDKLMQLEVKRITKLEEKKISLQADVSAWTDISGSLTTLTDSVDTLRKMTIWDRMTATSSNTAKLTASSTSSASPATYRITVTNLAQAHSVASNRAAALTGNPAHTSATDLVAAGVLTDGEAFTLEGQTVTIGATESLNTLAGKINTASIAMAQDKQVLASIVDNRLVITRQNSGASTLVMANTSGTPLGDLGIWNGATYVNELTTAQSASFTVNNAAVTRESNTGLTDVIEGVTLNLLDKTGTAETLTLTVGHDKDSIRAAIDDFISSYNSAVTKLQSYIEVDLSNPKKPQAGELQGDNMVGNILSNLRRLVTQGKSPALNETNASYTYDGRTGAMDSLDDIGVWTLDKENNISITDETRLDFMLDNHFDKVEQLFRGVGGSNGFEHGVGSDLYSYLYNANTDLTGSVAQRTNTIETEINRYQTKIDKMYDDLDTYEQRLWNQFTAMEDAVADMQSEISWLTSQLGSK